MNIWCSWCSFYVGETVISKDDVDEFIKIGKDLEIDSLLSPSENTSEKSDLRLEDELSAVEEEELSEEEEFELSKDSAGNVEDASFGEKSGDVDLMKSKETNSEVKPYKRKKRKYSCSKCDKILSSKQSLDAHVEKIHHFVYDSFKCDKCDKIYSCKANLERHMNAEHESIVYNCNVKDCGKSFRYHTGLKMHIKVQHENKKVKCQEGNCNKSFKYGSALLVHQKAQHQNKFYTCEICRWVTSYAYNLKKHYKSVHKLDNTDESVKDETNL